MLYIEILFASSNARPYPHPKALIHAMVAGKIYPSSESSVLIRVGRAYPTTACLSQAYVSDNTFVQEMSEFDLILGRYSTFSVVHREKSEFDLILGT